MKFAPRLWFSQIWPRPTGRMAVISDYAALAAHPHLLTDIALRGFVFTAHPQAADNLFEAGRREGRRELALELIELAGMDPRRLWDLVEKPPAPDAQRLSEIRRNADG